MLVSFSRNCSVIYTILWSLHFHTAVVTADNSPRQAEAASGDRALPHVARLCLLLHEYCAMELGQQLRGHPAQGDCRLLFSSDIVLLCKTGGINNLLTKGPLKFPHFMLIYISLYSVYLFVLVQYCLHFVLRFALCICICVLDDPILLNADKSKTAYQLISLSIHLSITWHAESKYSHHRLTTNNHRQRQWNTVKAYLVLWGAYSVVPDFHRQICGDEAVPQGQVTRWWRGAVGQKNNKGRAARVNTNITTCL